MKSLRPPANTHLRANVASHQRKTKPLSTRTTAETRCRATSQKTNADFSSHLPYNLFLTRTAAKTVYAKSLSKEKEQPKFAAFSQDYHAR